MIHFFCGKSDKFLLTHTPNKIPVAHNVTRAGRGNDTIRSIRKTFQRADFLKFINT